ncbi:hypothetical protein R3P38DRAFT_3485389 [Favolaschia claudopus]|uniref:F-box domain-containing protein n=1 Tax=Favolaschia claudopus TaxID=2862362 RepID=A0AAW0CC29_9AGAR
MHPCLAIPEILELVISVGLARDHTITIRRDIWDAKTVDGALAALARTCKHFHEFAQNELWKEQYGILNLIRCMPEDLWAFKYGSLTRVREVRPTDWDRVSKNAARVKSLTIKDSEYPKLRTKVYETVGNSPGGWFLPNLQHLCWDDYSANLTCINLFLGPRLTSIEFEEIRDDRCFTTLETLAQTHPQLESVTVKGVTTRAKDEDRMRLRNFIRQLPHLHNLKVHYIDPDTLLRLGAPESGLYGLTTSPHTFGDLVGHTDTYGTRFPELRRLYIESGKNQDAEKAEMEPVLHFLRVCNSPPLRFMCFYFMRKWSWDQLYEFYSLLARRRTTRNTLETLFISLLGERSQKCTPHPNDVFHPLLHCNNLVNIYIGVPAGYDLDDEAVGNMSSAWPYLQTLSLESDSDYEPKCTLMALHHIARNCQQLYELVLAFNASDVPDIPVSLEGLPQCTLKNLDVGASPILDGSIERVADFIGFSFSRITRISTAVRGGYMNVRPERWLWKMVEVELLGLRASETEQ